MACKVYSLFALQREAKSSSGWPDVHVFHPLSELTAGSIKKLQGLEGVRSVASDYK